MALPHDYLERVYAGVLGKIIGVYLGRPFEGWSHEKILAELGEINYYVHEKRQTPLIVTDDDISGTFTFVRALPDHGNSRAITPAQIGQAWLNYIIENRAILWWGGMGNSTEHTAFLRLKAGIPAPQSGSIALNSKVVAEQIGAQIFIDGWAMVAPGDPALAVDLARKAGSVSHDGEALYGAMVVAAIESLAFIEKDLNKLLDVAVGFIPKDCVIYRMIAELRGYHAREPRDWRAAFRGVMAKTYNYETYGGNCHMVPNHGLIILALLYGDDSFQKSLMIANTCGWDTDCNSGNVGCIMGIKNGLAGIDAGPDWRTPVADRLLLPTAEGGSGINDAVTQACQLVNIGRALAGEKAIAPKGGARFHFELPGSVQGFRCEDSVEARGVATVENIEGQSKLGSHSLAIAYRHLAPGRAARVATPTFMTPAQLAMTGYGMICSPTLYPGQTVRAAFSGCAKSRGVVEARLYTSVFGAGDQLTRQYCPSVLVNPGSSHTVEWKITGSMNAPIAEVGLEVLSDTVAEGRIYLDYLTWDGQPEGVFEAPDHNGTAWRRAWVDAADSVWHSGPGGLMRLTQNSGRGMLMQGTRQWQDYSAAVTATPHLAKAFGLAARVQGLRRYYALLLQGQRAAQLIKMRDAQTVLAEAALPWEYTKPYDLSLTVIGNRVTASVNGKRLLEAVDAQDPLMDGGMALIVEEGRVQFGAVKVAAAR